MRDRADLHTLLLEVTGLDEDHVHFQPPNGMQMSFQPAAITYSRNREATQHADNLPYRSAIGYTVTVISKDPDNPYRTQVAALPYCSFDRWYATDGLNHDVYTLFY